MAKYYDIDNDVRINGKLTINGDTTIPLSYNLLVGGNITGNILSGNTAQITTINGTTANITNINSTGTISGSTLKGNGSALTVNGTTANGGTVPISNGWAYTHENKIGSLGHIPSGGTATTFLRGDNTWVTPNDTYVTGLSSTAGGNGTLTVTRNTGGNLTLDLSHNHDSSYLKLVGGTLTGNLNVTANMNADRYYQNANGAPTSNLGSPSVTEMALFDAQFTNKTWFYDPTKLTFEYTNDGVTWIDLAPSTNTIKDFVSGLNNSGINIPNGCQQFRITIHNDGNYVYLNALYMYWSTNSHQATVKIDKQNSQSATWLSHTSSTTKVSAWPGHLYLPFSTIPFSVSTGSSSYHSDIRIIFTPTWSSDPTYGTYPITLYGMEVWGGYPTGRRTIYSWDRDRNVTFPNGMTASTFIGSGTSLTVGGTPTNGSVNPINAGWAYTHVNTYGLGSHVPTGGTATTFLRGDGTWVTPTDTWRPIDQTPTSGNTNNAISSDWAYSHTKSTGIGSHVPSGGTTSTFLRGDGTWVTPTDTNNYVTSISGNGNGTFYLDRSGLTTLSLDLSHNHDSLYLGINAKASDSDKLDNLDSTQFVRSDQGGTVNITSTNLNISGTSATPLILTRNNTTNVNMQFVHSSANAFLGIDNTGQLKFGSVADLNGSGYTVYHSNNFNPSSKLDATAFATHTGSTGLGSHVPVGGTATTFLRGDMTWVTPTDTNYYVTSLSSTAGGNGTLTVSRNATTALTIDLSHTHSQYVANNATNQTVLTGFTMSGNSYVGTSTTSGALIVRTTNGASAIQLAGDNASQQAGTTIYMNASGNANFNGTVTANGIAVTSTNLVTNLNSQMINGVKEPQLAKNTSIYEEGGMGVYTGLSVAQQTVPNMTVLVSSGTAYTNTGMRVTYSNQSVSLSASSATYDRKDVVYIQGSSAGANEGVVTVATGTPASTPVEPSIPSDAIKLAVVLVPKNIGSIQNSYITDTRLWKNLFNLNGDTYINNNLYVQGTLNTTLGCISVSRPFRNNTQNTSLTFTAGTTTMTWTHNLNQGTNYVVRLSCNSSEPHVYWSNKLTDKVTINLDDVCETDVIVDVSIEYY